MAGRPLYTFDNKLVDHSYFVTADSRNYCLWLPNWCPCINRSASHSMANAINNAPLPPSECTITSSSCNNDLARTTTETVTSNAPKRPSLSLKQCRKRPASDELSEQPIYLAKIRKRSVPVLWKPKAWRSDSALISVKTI